MLTTLVSLRRQRYMDPLLKAADGGLLGGIEFGVIVYQTRSPFRCVWPSLEPIRSESATSLVCRAKQGCKCSWLHYEH